ncbi:hypothetical protein [Luteibacter sp. UNCMF366Tsu5.1]|uniref:hypothetical protein n=1 Tax=Luteibacter sp. UNCMF366Tsu5.1 TaxID=1502758 RepID=UPI002100EEF4|nr:hypothetical protein [Luteibacter sp. UNCMF366Tsu5.1]
MLVGASLLAIGACFAATPLRWLFASRLAPTSALIFAATDLQQSNVKMARPPGPRRQGAGLVAGAPPDIPMSKFALTARSRRVIVSLAAVVVVASALTAYASLRVHHADAQSSPSGTSSVTHTADDGASSGVDILLGLARDATREGRLVSPQGNNAYEYYLSVMQLDPSNVTAQDALRETLPFASQEIERLINRRDLEEARREIALLRDYDPTNYTLIILGAKLDAQQQVVTVEDEAKADAMRQRNGSSDSRTGR